MLPPLVFWGQGTFLPGPLLLAGKLDNPSNLVHIVGKNNGTSFLIDTGSSFSIIPFKSSSPPTGPRLRAANGPQIPCWGKQQLTIAFGGRHFSWNFLLAAVDFHVIGVDFLQHFNLLVDVTAKTLREQHPATAVTAVTVSSPPSASPPSSSPPSTSPPSASPPSTPPPSSTAEEKALLAEFSSVINEEGRLPPTTHGIKHHIVTSGRPVTAKFKRLDNIKLAAAKAEFQRLEKEGIIRRSNSD